MSTAFEEKLWRNGQAGGTRLDAAGLIDLEARLAAYIESRPWGPAGVDVTWRGRWDPDIEYDLGDGVYRNGYPYVSNIDTNLGHDPETDDGSSWGRLFPAAPVVFTLDEFDGSATYDLTLSRETWFDVTLAGDSDINLTNFQAGSVAVLFVTQSPDGDQSLVVSNTIVSLQAPIELGPEATTLLFAYSPDGDELILFGAEPNRPMQELTADHVITSLDANTKLQGRNEDGDIILLVPLDSVADIAIDSEIPLIALGLGDLVVGAQTGVSVRSQLKKRRISRPGRGRLAKTGANEWVLDGEIEPSTTFDVVSSLAPAGWWDTTQLVGLADGDPIVQLTDFSGNNKHGSAPNAGARAMYKMRGRNGYPVAFLDGVDDCYGFVLPSTVEARTVFMVIARAISGPAHNGFAFSFTDGGDSLYEQNNVYKWGKNQAGTVVDLTAPATTLSVITMRFTSESVAEVWVNGTLVATFDPFNTYHTSGGLNFAIGAQANLADASVWKGDFCECILVNSAVGDSLRVETEEDYLMTKWGI